MIIEQLIHHVDKKVKFFVLKKGDFGIIHYLVFGLILTFILILLWKAGGDRERKV